MEMLVPGGMPLYTYRPSGSCTRLLVVYICICARNVVYIYMCYACVVRYVCYVYVCAMCMICMHACLQVCVVGNMCVFKNDINLVNLLI